MPANMWALMFSGLKYDNRVPWATISTPWAQGYVHLGCHPLHHTHGAIKIMNLNAYHWVVRGNWSTQMKPTQHGEHVNSTHTTLEVWGNSSNHHTAPYSCVHVMVFPCWSSAFMQIIQSLHYRKACNTDGEKVNLSSFSRYVLRNCI